MIHQQGKLPLTPPLSWKGQGIIHISECYQLTVHCAAEFTRRELQCVEAVAVVVREQQSVNIRIFAQLFLLHDYLHIS